MQTETEHPATQEVSRRRFFAYVGWASFASFWLGVAIATVRFLFPRVLYEPSQRFDAGKPEDYQVGEVSTRLKKAGYNGFCGSCSTPFMEPDTSKFSSQLSA
jgi:hypothetical protein